MTALVQERGTSVITGLTDAYSAVGTTVLSNIPVGYSDGKSEVRVSMYDNGTLLNCSPAVATQISAFTAGPEIASFISSAGEIPSVSQSADAP